MHTLTPINPIKSMLRHIQYGLIFSVLAMFCASLVFPAIKVGTWPAEKGVDYFLVGWLGPVAGHFDWFANPLIGFGLKNAWQKNYARAVIYSILALLLTLQTLYRGCMVQNEGGYCQSISEYLIGYWLWVSSASLLVVWAIAGCVFIRKKP